METKICTKCEKEKNTGQFFWRDKKKKKRHSHCKECCKKHRAKTSKEHYLKYRDDYIKRAKARRKKVGAELRKNLFKYLSEHPCIECGEGDIVVLDFDHRDSKQKSSNISTMINNRTSWEEIKLEISKCDVLCANCHRRKTAKQFGWHRLSFKNYA